MKVDAVITWELDKAGDMARERRRETSMNDARWMRDG